MTNRSRAAYFLALLALAGCSAADLSRTFGRTVPIYHASNRSLPTGYTGSIEDVGADIHRALELQQWEINHSEPGKLVATKRRGQSGATVNIAYDTARFSITFRNSASLDYDVKKKTIHKIYNAWVRALEESIQRELESRSSASGEHLRQADSWIQETLFGACFPSTET